MAQAPLARGGSSAEVRILETQAAVGDRELNDVLAELAEARARYRAARPHAAGAPGGPPARGGAAGDREAPGGPSYNELHQALGSPSYGERAEPRRYRPARPHAAGAPPGSPGRRSPRAKPAPMPRPALL